jgi:hypothetical protein
MVNLQPQMLNSKHLNKGVFLSNKWGVLHYSMLIAGTGLIGISIGFEIVANIKLEAAVELYNKSQRENNNANLNIGFSPNGVNLRLNF